MTDVTTWTGWAGGIGVGCYALVQLLVSGRTLGVSSGYGAACGLVLRTSFFRQTVVHSRWRVWFLVGIPFGGLLAALTSPGPLVASFSLGSLYDAVLPASIGAKSAVLLAGGVLMGWGARLAGGCTSGHAITGLALLNGPSFIAAAGFFAGGIAAVHVLFRFIG